MKKVLAVMLALIVTACLCTGLAYAARDPALAVLPFEIKGNHNDEPCVIVIKALTEGAPMPESNKVEVKGNGTFSFKEIKFERVGMYEYEVYQEAGTNADCIYDDTVYHIRFSVTNGKNNDILTAFTCIAEGDEEKDNGLIFSNSYIPEETIPDTPTPYTGDENNLEQWKMFSQIAVFSALALTGLLIITLISYKKKEQEE